MNELGELVVEYYRDLSNLERDVRVVVAAGALPVLKRLSGLPVVGNASGITNLLSAVGLKYFPDLKIGRQVLGTNRVFGLAGRLNLAAAAGFVAYDLTSIILSIPHSDGVTVGDRLNQVILDSVLTDPNSGL